MGFNCPVCGSNQIYIEKQSDAVNPNESSKQKNMKTDKQDSIMEFKKYVVAILLGMQSYLSLNEFTLDIEFLDTDIDGCFADIKIDVVYLNASIRVYPVTKELYRDKKYFQVFSHLVHELCHLFTEPINLELSKYMLKGEDNTTLIDITERQTQRMTIAITRNVSEHIWNPDTDRSKANANI